MDFLIGFILGVIVMRVIVKVIAKRNRLKFINDLNNTTKPGRKMVLDAINNNIDQLVKYNGQEVEVEEEYYLSCMIDGNMIMLPEKCLKPIYMKEKC